MRLDQEGIRRGDRSALNDLLNVCQKAARIGAKKAGAFSYAEDVGQDIFMLVLGDWIDHYDPTKEAEPFLIETARRLSLTYLRRTAKELSNSISEPKMQFGVNGDEYNMSLGGDSHLTSFDSPALDAQPELDGLSTVIADELQAKSKQARELLVERLRARDRLYASKIDTAPAKRAEVITEDARYIIEARARLGLDRAGLARQVDVAEYKLAAIEEGKRPRAASEVAVLVRGLERDGLRRIEDLTNSGESFYRGLCRVLEVEPDNVSLVAKMLGVHRSTIFRWRTRRTKPLASITTHFHSLAERIAAERERGVTE